MKRIFILSLLIIAAISILTRFIALNKVPPNLSNDEISIAYDAYSIAKTGRDEHNHFLPISFESSGDYKAPLAAYIIAPFTAILGNTEYAARMPSAIFGSLTVLILGLLTYELTKNKYLSLLSSMALATTPWHIYTSRMALETNISLFFFVLGIYLYFKAKTRHWLYILSFLTFALSMYAYHTEKGLVPFIVVALFLLSKKTLLKSRTYIAGAAILIVAISPLIFDYFASLGTHARANTELIHVSLLKFIPTIFNNYSAHIDPRYLFFDGLNLMPKADPFQVGLFLMPLIPALIIGIIKIKKYFKNDYNFIYIWLLLSPVIPSMAKGGGNLTRDLPMVAPFCIVIAVGLVEIFSYLKNKKIISLIYLALILFSFVQFLAIYYYHFPKENGENFQYGYKQVGRFIRVGNNV